VVCQPPVQQQSCLNPRGARLHLLQTAAGGDMPAARAAGTVTVGGRHVVCLIVDLRMHRQAAANHRSLVHHTCTQQRQQRSAADKAQLSLSMYILDMHFLYAAGGMHSLLCK
jgi:hypothetical protein